MATQHILRWATTDDLPAIATLVRAHYGPHRTLASLAWQINAHQKTAAFAHIDGPSGFVAEHEGQIVGFLGCRLLDGFHGITPVNFAEYVSALVHKDHRGQNLMGRLQDYTIAELSRVGIQQIFAIPSGHMINAMRAQGFHTIGTLRQFEYQLPATAWILPQRRREVTEIRGDVRTDGQLPLTLTQSSEKVRQRYIDRPNFACRILTSRHGTAVCRFHGRSRRYVTISDLGPRTSASAILDHLAHVTAKLSVFPRRKISCWAVEGASMAGALAAFGYVSVPKAEFPILIRATHPSQAFDPRKIVADMMIGDFDAG